MARRWSTVWVVRFGDKPSAVIRRRNSPRREATIISRTGPMMADTLYSRVTRTTLLSCGSSICKLARWLLSRCAAVSISAPEDLKKVFSEETEWRAQPQVAPDGRRVLFSSYHGRQWQQLWLTTIQGASPFPLTFGEFDRTQARFSPDGNHVGYISNEEGNTSLWVQEVVGGARIRINARQRHYLKEVGQLKLSVRDEHGKRVPARVSVLAADGRAYAPDNAWMHADDGFDRSLQAFENHYFLCPGECTLILPIGDARLQVSHGLDYAITERNVAITTEDNTRTGSLN